MASARVAVAHIFSLTSTNGDSLIALRIAIGAVRGQCRLLEARRSRKVFGVHVVFEIGEFAEDLYLLIVAFCEAIPLLLNDVIDFST